MFDLCCVFSLLISTYLLSHLIARKHTGKVWSHSNLFAPKKETVTMKDEGSKSMLDEDMSRSASTVSTPPEIMGGGSGEGERKVEGEGGGKAEGGGMGEEGEKKRAVPGLEEMRRDGCEDMEEAK